MFNFASSVSLILIDPNQSIHGSVRLGRVDGGYEGQARCLSPLFRNGRISVSVRRSGCSSASTHSPTPLTRESMVPDRKVGFTPDDVAHGRWSQNWGPAHEDELRCGKDEGKELWGS